MSNNHSDVRGQRQGSGQVMKENTADCIAVAHKCKQSPATMVALASAVSKCEATHDEMCFAYSPRL